MGFLSLPDKWRDEDDEPPRMNVSVIVATCGDEKWEELANERAVPSVLGETVAHDERDTVFIHYPDFTVASARNAAARLVTESDWLCFLDADDELEPGYLDAMARAYQEALFTPVAHAVEPLLVPLLRRVPSGPYDPSQPAWATYPNKGQWPKVNECVIGTLVHRNLFETVGGFRNDTDDWTPIDLYEDWDLWLRCYDAGARLVYTDAVYREHINPSGRNYSRAPSATYDAIWRDHEARIA